MPRCCIYCDYYEDCTERDVCCEYCEYFDGENCMKEYEREYED